MYWENIIASQSIVTNFNGPLLQIEAIFELSTLFIILSDTFISQYLKKLFNSLFLRLQFFTFCDLIKTTPLLLFLPKISCYLTNISLYRLHVRDEALKRLVIRSVFIIKIRYIFLGCDIYGYRNLYIYFTYGKYWTLKTN